MAATEKWLNAVDFKKQVRGQKTSLRQDFGNTAEDTFYAVVAIFVVDEVNPAFRFSKSFMPDSPLQFEEKCSNRWACKQ